MQEFQAQLMTQNWPDELLACPQGCTVWAMVGGGFHNFRFRFSVVTLPLTRPQGLAMSALSRVINNFKNPKLCSVETPIQTLTLTLTLTRFRPARSGLMSAR